MKPFLIFFSAFAFGAEGDFATHKADMLKNIDERIQRMNEHKSCVTAAADKEGLKKCHEAQREWRKSEAKEMRENRMNRMQNRIDKMKDKNEEKKPE